MKRPRSIASLGLLLLLALALASCGGSDGAAQQGGSANAEGGTQQAQTTGGMKMGSGQAAPTMLVRNGEYSDERFIDMMVPHHQMAIEQAKVAQQKVQHPQLKQLADNIISSQQKEIKELKSIKQREFGSSETPSRMAPSDMANMGMAMPG